MVLPPGLAFGQPQDVVDIEALKKKTRPLKRLTEANVVVHFWGIAAGLPWAQWDESWAYPVSAVLGAAAIWLLLTWLLARRSAAIRRGMPDDRYQDASPPVSQDRR